MSDYQWCLHCGRVSKKRELKRGFDSRCPFMNCDGSILDLVDWDEFRRQVGGLPEVPVENRRYRADGRAVAVDLM